MNRLIRMCGVLAIAAMPLCGCEKPSSSKTPVIVQPGTGNNNGGDNGENNGDDNTSGTAFNGVVGSTMPAWEEGQFDIHFVNTTAGECMFLIFPDGTQMLIDAAGSRASTGTVSSTTNTGIRSRWDPTANNSAYLFGDFISRYIRKCQAWTGNSKIDYILLSHFHNDHFGGANGLPTSDMSSTYTKQSLPLILDNFTVGKLMDRGWPDYNYPFDMCTQADNASNVKNYVTAVKWHNSNSGMAVERFVAGSNSQITLQKNASRYPTFSVRNLAVNGNIWTGSGDTYTSTFPDNPTYKNSKSITSADNCPAENHCSCAAKFSYGSFDFFTGGDLQYNGASTYSWKDIETPVAKVCGQVEVMKADHHGSVATNGCGETLKNSNAMNYFKPQCWVVNSWTDIHPRQAIFEKVTSYVNGVDVFISNTCSDMEAYKNFDRVKGNNGHIVVRVLNGGSKFYVVTLTDSDEKMTIKKIAGPYYSK